MGIYFAPRELTLGHIVNIVYMYVYNFSSDHDVTVSDMGLSKSDYEYLRTNNPVDLQPSELQCMVVTEAEDPVTSLTSGNVQINAENSVDKTESLNANQKQNHSVQSNVDTSQMLVGQSNTNIVQVTSTNNMNPVYLDSGLGNTSGSLSSALQGMNLVGACTVPMADGSTELIQGPFHIVGDNTNIDPNVFTTIQLVDSNSVLPLQVPVQVVCDSANGENGGIHVLSVAVDDSSPGKSPQEVKADGAKNAVNQDIEQLIDVQFDEPRRTSTPLRQDAFDETILAGNIDDKQSTDTAHTVNESLEQKEGVVNKGHDNKRPHINTTALNYMGKTKQKKMINMIREVDEEDEDAKHLEPNEKPHNETYCRNWVKSSGVAQDDSESNVSANKSDVSSVSDIDIMNTSESSNLAYKKIPEVQKKNLSAAPLPTKCDTVRKSESSTMYVFLELQTCS